MQKRVLIVTLLLIVFSVYFPSAHCAPQETITRGQDILRLSLEDAILLAVRTNPNIESSRLSYISSNFNLWVQKWAFLPHYSFGGSVGYMKNRTNGGDFSGSHTYELNPGVSLTTPIGTQISVTGSNTKTTNYNPGVNAKITQPLMRGFGRPIVERALYNAYDSLYTSGLAAEGTLRRTVTDVINAYLEYVSAQKTIVISENAIKRAQQSVKQTKLFIKAGHKAGNELVTVEADLATAQAQLENDKNRLAETKNALLTAIGLDPNTPVEFAELNILSLFKRYHSDTLENTKRLALENDISYQTAYITLHGSQTRSLMAAEDQARPELNLVLNTGTGQGTGGGWNAGFNSLFNGVNQTRGATLSFQIPIDDQLAKQQVMDAKIALRTAELNLKQERWQKETSAINSWNMVRSQERALHFAENAERLQQKTYQVSYQKYLHGLIDSLQLQSAQVSLIKSQEALLTAQINYLKTLVSLDLLTGHTLKTWGLKVRLGCIN